MPRLSDIARECDQAVTSARERLVRAIRQAAAEGVSQREIAEQVGRSQPEVSRLLRFHGASPLGLRLRKARPEIQRLVREAGGSNVRVFGSVAVGTDHEGSDVDLLFTMGPTLTLSELGRLERELGKALEADVDLVPDTLLGPWLKDRVLREAVPL